MMKRVTAGNQGCHRQSGGQGHKNCIVTTGRPLARGLDIAEGSVSQRKAVVIAFNGRTDL